MHDVDGFTATPEEICFNGKGEKSHETYFIPQILPADSLFTRLDLGRDDGLIFAFTKTARKPYDILVVACLILGQRHFGKKDFRISSDGDIADWMAGLDLVNQTFDLQLMLMVGEDGEGFEVRDRIQDMPKVANMDEFVEKLNKY